jgi:hypothetical protein
MSAGKGDTPRLVDFKIYGENYDNIFRKQVEKVCDLDPECECTKEEQDD